MAGPDWEIRGDEYTSCNCDWGCPCQFEARPTHGDCKYASFNRIEEGQYGDTDLAGVVFGFVGCFPGAVHEGNGDIQLILDEGASNAQRDAIRRIVYNEDSDELLTHFSVYHAMSSTVHEPVVAPIELEIDIEARTARVRVPGMVSSDGTPIISPADGAEHRASISLPDGWEYKTAEMGSSTTKTTGAVEMDFADAYGQFNVLHSSNKGIVTN